MSDSDPTLKQIQAEFEQARQKFSRLQQDVKKVARLADAKTHSDRLFAEREQATFALGLAVWAGIKRGEIHLPASCAEELAALKNVEMREKALAMDISEVLQEGVEAAARMKKPAGKK